MFNGPYESVAYMARTANNPIEEEGLLTADCGTLGGANSTRTDSMFDMTDALPKVVTIRATSSLGNRISTLSVHPSTTVAKFSLGTRCCGSGN